MDIFQNSFLGIIQGLTEFLPVSSSGHLFLIETWLGSSPDLFLTVWLHAASLLAVMIYFRKRIVSLTHGFFTQNSEQGVVLRLALSTLLTFPLGIVVLYFINDGFLTLTAVGTTLVITGVAIIFSEKLAGTKTEITWLHSVITGLVQGLSVFPGISRSGATIATLVSLGISKRTAAEYSFLLSIPTILAVLVFGLVDLSSSTSLSQLLSASFIIPFVVTTLVSYVAIGYMVKFVEKHWIYFAPYCFVLGLILVMM